MGLATAERPRPTPTTSGPIRPAPARPALPAAVRRFGLWAAIATAATYTVFLVGYGVGPLLRAPWDIALPVGASILIAPCFVLLMVGVHHAAAESKRIWSHGALGFALLYAAFVSIVYITWLFVVEPHVLSGSQSAVAPFTFQKGSFIQMLDGLGYTYMSLAIFLTAPVFAGGRLARWIRGIAIASGPAAVGVLLSYVFFTFPLSLLGLPGTILVPVYAVLLAIFFHHAEIGAEAKE
jgi:hypothetical protein